MNLSRYPTGSYRELWAVSLPLMFGLLATNLMLFVDHLVLANFSTSAFHASVLAGSWVNFFQCTLGMLTSIGAVFVGQLNGAGAFEKVGQPLWQMLWFAIGSTALFVPLALGAGPLLLGTSGATPEALLYFKTSILTGPIYVAICACTGFFIGLGQGRIVALFAFITLAVHFVVNIFLVFVLELGAFGSALATGVSELVQLSLLFGTLLLPLYRKSYGTTSARLRPHLLFECLKVSLPATLGYLVELAAWVTVSRVLSSKNPSYLIIFAIGQSLLFIPQVFSEGLYNGIIAVGSNAIGMNRSGHMVRRAVTIVISMGLVALIPCLVFPQFLLDILKIGPLNHAYLVGFWIWTYFVMEAFDWVYLATLTARGETRMILPVNLCASWVGYVLPMVVLFGYQELAPVWFWAVACIHPALTTLALRYFLKVSATNSRAEDIAPLHSVVLGVTRANLTRSAN